MKYVSRQQLIESLRLLRRFRKSANSQGAQHVLPFLALRRKNIDTKRATRYQEADDFEFFNAYARVREGKTPYFDPIASQFRIKTHPHSNVATARKGTFFKSWHAGASGLDAEGKETWRLDPGYVETIRREVLSKAGSVTKVPALALAAFLLRLVAFPDHFQPKDLGGELKRVFNLSDTEFDALFETESPIGEFSEEKALSGEEVLEAIEQSDVVSDSSPETRTGFQELGIKDDDEILAQVRLLLDDGYAGVIFVGPPGTSKSWYAVQVALALTDGDPSRIRKIQFHRSFQYEHFVEGFVPNEEGTGFELRDQLMLRLVREAQAQPGVTYVVLIDELSRSDPGRVFGELLTYMEPSRRNETFYLASGREATIPANIVFLATMNSRDKSVQEIDDAFDRRMAKLSFPPTASTLEDFLTANEVEETLKRRIGAFFEWVNEKYPLGHTYFRGVKDATSLQRLWKTQLRFLFEKHFKYDQATLEEISRKFVEITGVGS